MFLTFFAGHRTFHATYEPHVTAPKAPTAPKITNGFNFVDWSRTSWPIPIPMPMPRLRPRTMPCSPWLAKKGDFFAGSQLMVCECNCQCAGVQSMPKCILKHCFGYAFCHMASAGYAAPPTPAAAAAGRPCWPGQNTHSHIRTRTSTHKSQCQTDKSAYFICILLG